MASLSGIDVFSELKRLKQQTKTHHSHYLSQKDFEYTHKKSEFSKNLVYKVQNDNLVNKKRSKAINGFFLIRPEKIDQFLKFVSESIKNNNVRVVSLQKQPRGVYKVVFNVKIDNNKRKDLNLVSDMPLGVSISFSPVAKKVYSIKRANSLVAIVDPKYKILRTFYAAADPKTAKQLSLEDLDKYNKLCTEKISKKYTQTGFFPNH
ncbi:hypothetical protein [Candidatus Hydrogenosomobacter endosymbioticus]|uniref:Uncharacterized protein n=1 Tax=Candidatus Hydrogenosomobacter endosymbioticus TaxID=2558174 RepID=A0ABN6L378_9PROT|nr:hypothetical protein [Candidatus Hydrogenosomobacter endosymbioticus]BDB96364.1 hypothetical protein HYD_4970 [Candidatus Hydrogenosomobacter endosymbioticus]